MVVFNYYYLFITLYDDDYDDNVVDSDDGE